MWKYFENKDLRIVEIPSEDTKIIEFNQYQAQFIIEEDLERLIEKIDGCKNNPESSSTSKVGERIPADVRYSRLYIPYSISTISSFKSIEKKHDVFRGKDWIKKFCEYLREHSMEIINIKQK